MQISLVRVRWLNANLAKATAMYSVNYVSCGELCRNGKSWKLAGSAWRKVQLFPCLLFTLIISFDFSVVFDQVNAQFRSVLSGSHYSRSS